MSASQSHAVSIRPLCSDPSLKRSQGTAGLKADATPNPNCSNCLLLTSIPPAVAIGYGILHFRAWTLISVFLCTAKQLLGSPAPSPQVAAFDNIWCRINLGPIEVSGNSASMSQLWSCLQLVKHFQLLQEKRCSTQAAWLTRFISRGSVRKEETLQLLSAATCSVRDYMQHCFVCTHRNKS